MSSSRQAICSEQCLYGNPRALHGGEYFAIQPVPVTSQYALTYIPL